MSLQLDTRSMSFEGQEKMESDYQRVERRDGGKTSRQDFALGWMACAARYGIRGAFLPEMQRRLWP